MASREEQEYSSQAPAGYIGDLLSQTDGFLSSQIDGILSSQIDGIFIIRYACSILFILEFVKF